MSDNVSITPGSGKVMGADEVVDSTLGTVTVGYGKIMDGTIDSTNKLVVTSGGAAKVDGTATTQPVSAASLPLPALAATSTKQSDGSQKTQVVDDSGNVIGATSNALDVNIKSGNPTTIATTHTDTSPATQNITAADAASTSTAQQNAQSAITGTPTANSAAIFTISGLATIDVQVTGTWVATLSVEISMDGGTTYFTRGFHLAGTTYTVGSLTSNATGTLSVAGMTNFRIRATAYTSGTATVKVSGSVNPGVFYIANSPQISDGTTPSQKLAINASGQVSESNFPTTVDTNSGTKSASTLRVVLATDQPALTNKLLVTPDSVALPANQSVNVSQIAGGTAINSGVTGAQAVGGDTASAATDAGNPVKVGGKYLATKPTFTDGQRGDLQIGTRGSAATSLFVADSTLAAKFNTDNADAIAVSSNSDKLTVMNRGTVFNGTTWDRQYGDATNGAWVNVKSSVGINPSPSTPVLKSGLTNTASAVISSAAATLNDYYVYNPNATVAYVQIFDVATAGGVTVGTTTPKWSVGIPATSAANISGLSLTFANGIQVCATTTATGSTAPGTALDANFGYR